VLELYARHKATLGFMPDTGFKDRVRRGTLLAAETAAGELAGYVMYDLPRQHVRMIHLCVAAGYRGLGAARALVDEVSRRHADRLGVLLRCRRDYAAHQMWPRLDFAPRSEQPGRSAAGAPLTVWWRDHGHPDLFTVQDDSDRLLTVIDQNVFVDLYVRPQRSGAEESAALIADWLGDQLDLAVTPQLLVEIDRLPQADDRHHQRGLAARLTTLQPKQSTLRAAYEVLDQVATTAGMKDQLRADVRHLAAAAAAGADLFVTRDTDLIRVLGQPAEEHFGLRTLRPSDVVVHLDQLAQAAAYQPAALLGTGYSMQQLPPGHDSELRELFLNRPAGERRAEFDRLLRAATGTPEASRRVIRDPAGDLAALLISSRNNGEILVPFMRVAAHRLQSTLGRQLLLILRQDARQARVSRIQVTEPHLSATIRHALTDEGYLQTHGAWVGAVIDICGPWTDILNAVATALPPTAESLLAEVAAAGPTTISAAWAERAWWPAKPLDADLPSYIVPIKPPWAEDLFGLSGTLHARPDPLGISREHIYYRAPRPQPVTAPGRILWYASGTGRRGIGAVVACSRLVEVLTDTPAALHARFRHLGVWQRQQIETAAAGGLACALRFADTEILPRRVLWERLTTLAENCRLGTLQSPTKIDSAAFAAIYQEGRRGPG
jgi:hypothetical protein